MGETANSLSAYEESLKRLWAFWTNTATTTTTNWQHFFSPTVYFGCNVEDIEVERHVLSKVGSYGSQINRILDVLSVLVGQLDRGALTSQELDFVREFEKLAVRADDAATGFQGGRPHGITAAEVDRVVEGIRSLSGPERSLMLDRLNKVLAP